MEHLSDRLLWLTIGGIIGLIVGYFVRDFREMKREVDELYHEKTGGASKAAEHAPDDEASGYKFFTFQNVMYFVLMLLVSYAAFTSANTQRNVLKSQCIGAVSSRDAQREIVQQIYVLAIGSIQRDTKAPPLTARKLELYNAYIDRVNAFRAETFKLIKPSEVCSQYVHDDHVKPPTPPQEHLTQ